MQQLNCRQDSGAGASVPCCMLRQWVSLYGELLFRQEQELQEHLHLDENSTVRGGVYSLHIHNSAAIPGAVCTVVTHGGERVIVRGETCHARNVHTMNKFTSDQPCHSLMEQRSWRR